MRFCNTVNARRYGMMQGFRPYFLVRSSATDDIPATDPDVPDRYKRCIQSPPITARVIESLKERKEGFSSERIVVTIDAGSDHGIVEGLAMFMADDETLASLTITKVMPQTSSGKLRQFRRSQELPAPGTPVSTRKLE